MRQLALATISTIAILSATAAGAARRLLIDPDTDLLARRPVAEEVPDAVVAEEHQCAFWDPLTADGA